MSTKKKTKKRKGQVEQCAEGIGDLPAVQLVDERVVAVVCSDLHLCDKPPVSRLENRSEWFSAMGFMLEQIADLVHDHSAQLIIAGDIFDRWDVSPEVINLALNYIHPGTLVIPGQHDLPNHSFNEMHRSALKTLELAGHVTVMERPTFIRDHDYEGYEAPVVARVHPFGWGYHVEPLSKPSDKILEIAVCHQYVWSNKSGYQGAPPDQNIVRASDYLKGYDVAVFGDNHTPFDALARNSGCIVFNCGSTMRRVSTQFLHRPRVGLIRGDGSVTTHYLCVEHDKMKSPEDDELLSMSEATNPQMSEFIEALGRTLAAGRGMFEESVKRLLDRKDVDDKVKELVRIVMGL